MKIAVVDKSPLLRKGMIAELRDHFGEFASHEASELAGIKDPDPDFHPDIVILGMDDTLVNSNIASIRVAKKWCPNSAIVILDNVYFPLITKLYLNEGVKGYMMKETLMDELADCIKLVRKGKRYISLEVLISISRESVTPLSHFRRTAGNRASLTARQLEIARYVADGMSTKWIANTLERKDSTISTVKSVVFKKLGISTVLQLKEVLCSFYDTDISMK